MIDEALAGRSQAEVACDEPAENARSRLVANVIEAAVLILIVGFALVLRFTGIGWGIGYYLHPDELFMTNVLSSISMPSSISQYFDSATSPLNPFNYGTGFVYGTFPLFAAEWLGSFTSHTSIQDMQVPGRWLSALADTGTVVLVWWIGRMLFGRLTGLLAALLLSATMLNVQAAHYFTADSWSAFFATATFAFVLAAWQQRRWLMYALAGLALGLAVASKPNLLAAIGFIALPTLETVRLYGWGALVPRFSRLPEDDETPRTFPVVLASALAMFVAIWTFRILQPYAFQGPSVFSFRLDPRWLADIRYWQRVQSGEIDYYPGIQWVERAPILFMLDNLVKWGMGPGLGLAALAGMMLLTGKIVWRTSWPSWMILGMVGWVAFHILYFGIGMVKTQRYLLPAYPLLVVMAAMTLVLLFRWARRHGALRLPGLRTSIRFPRWIHPGYVIPMLVVASTVLYGIAFTAVFRHEQTRAVASVWITQHVPDGSVIGNEYWDLGLPVRVPELAGHSYTTINLHLYADENAEKVDTIVSQLDQVDYIVLSSNRLVGSIPRMPERYPMATRYYEALFSGELGFEQVAHFTSFPELFGIAIDDRSAEETLTVYDHPEVTIFRKTSSWNPQTARYILAGALGQGGLNIRPIQTQPHRMMLGADQATALSGHGSWLSIIDLDSLANRYPLIVWYLALQILSIPAALFLWRFTPWLPDRGYALAKTIGPFTIAWVVWWLCSWNWLTFSRSIIVAVWIVTAVVSGWLLWRGRSGLGHELVRRWRWIIATETLLLAGFVLATYVRRQNPDLWLPGRTGTQLHDMATFNAMIRTPHFPAYDPWFANGTIHDVVFGVLPWSVTTRLTGIAPEIAYSLTLVTLTALVVLNSWNAACVAIARLRPKRGAGNTIASGLLAPLLILAIGSWSMAQRIGADDWTLNFDGSLRAGVIGLWQAIVDSPETPGGFWFLVNTVVGPGILEFPQLSYLTGELAVQQVTMPVFLAGLVLSIGFVFRPLDKRRSLTLTEPGRSDGADVPGSHVLALLGTWQESLGFLIGFGLVASWVLAANVLAGGVALGMVALMIALGMLAHSQIDAAWPFVRDGVVALSVMTIVPLVAAWPFLLHYGYIPTKRVPLAQSMGVGEFVGFAGAAFAIMVMYVMWRLWQLAWSLALDGLIGPVMLVTLPLLLLAVLVLAWLLNLLIVILLVLFVLTGIFIWSEHSHRIEMVIGSLLLVAIGLAIIGNRVQLEGWDQQQNVPMQFGILTWLVTGIAATVAIAIVFQRIRDSRRARGVRLLTGTAAILMLLLAVGMGAVYPAIALPTRADTRLAHTTPTLDAWAFMTHGALDIDANGMAVARYPLAGDLAAVVWIRENIDGLPVILETPGKPGAWGGRISALTGLPTVLGSAEVARQQRPGMERAVDWRLDDVNAIYGSVGTYQDIVGLVLRYNVQYIYVGQLEQVTWGSNALGKFDQAVGLGLLDVAYQHDGVTIYRVADSVG